MENYSSVELNNGKTTSSAKELIIYLRLPPLSTILQCLLQSSCMQELQ